MRYLIDLAYKYRKHAVRAAKAAQENPKPKRVKIKGGFQHTTEYGAQFYNDAAESVIAMNLFLSMDKFEEVADQLTQDMHDATAACTDFKEAVSAQA